MSGGHITSCPGVPTQAGFAWVGLLTTNSATVYEEFVVPARFHLGVRSGALFTEHEAPQLVAQLLHFFRVICFSKALCQLEKGLFLFLTRLDSLLNEIQQDPVIAEAALLRHGFHLLCDFSRQGYAPPHLLCCCPFCCRHTVINIHHFGAIRSGHACVVPTGLGSIF